MEKGYKRYAADLTLEKLEKVSGRAWVRFNPYDLFNAAESILIPIEGSINKAIDREQVRQDLVTTFKIADMLNTWHQQPEDIKFPQSDSDVFNQLSKDKCSISGFSVDVEMRARSLQKTLGLILK